MRSFRLIFCTCWLALAAAHAIAQERLDVSSWHSTSASVPSHAASPGAAALDQAAASQRYALVFFWKTQDPATEKAWSTFQTAAARYREWADTVSVQVTDPGERAIVARFGVDRAPMPMVLAIAPCGAITKALTGPVDENLLRAAFVSPCTELCLKAMQDRKLVFVCVVNASQPGGRAAIPQGVQNFRTDARYAQATEVVLLNAQDQSEAAFLKQLQVDPRTPQPVTVFMAPPGSVLGKFTSSATKEHFVAKLAAAQSNPCAGGKCGPNGCGPKR